MRVSLTFELGVGWVGKELGEGDAHKLGLNVHLNGGCVIGSFDVHAVYLHPYFG